MDSNTCFVCGKKAAFDSLRLCLSCQILKNEYLKVVMDYIKKNSYTSVEQIALHTGIDKRYILYYEEQGLINLDISPVTDENYIFEELRNINYKSNPIIRQFSGLKNRKQAMG